MKLKECMLYTGIVVCLAAGIFYFIFREEPLYRYTKKIELLKNDNILETSKDEVTDFLWRGYSPNQHPKLDEKSEAVLPEIVPYIHSTPIIKAYQIEKMAYRGSFDKIFST